MTRQDRINIACAANAILWLWRDVIQEAERNEPDPMRRCWYKADQRQAYQDSLISMRTCGLIEDYDVVKQQVRINGEWYASRRVVVR